MASLNTNMKNFKTTPLQIAAYIAGLIPLLSLGYDFWQGSLGPDPIRARHPAHRQSSPDHAGRLPGLHAGQQLFGYKPAIRLRRPLGLFSFMYAAIHFAIFIALDYGFDFSLIPDALLEKRYALAGLIAGSILLLLALTSTQGSQRRLKQNWKRLHRLVYLASVLAVVHFIWLVKQGVLEPWIWALVVLLLLALRIPPIKKAVGSLHGLVQKSAGGKIRPGANRPPGGAP